jgi:TolB-like protein/DNA-binding winged helix-turn-helix (wHTH) protein
MEPVPPIYRFGAFRLDPSRRALEHDGVPVAMSARAFDILEYLIQTHDRVVGREELMAHAWPGVIVDPSNLTVQISALRRALGDTGEDPLYVATVTGRGYRFIGRLEAQVADVAEPVAAIILESVAEASSTGMSLAQAPMAVAAPTPAAARPLPRPADLVTIAPRRRASLLAVAAMAAVAVVLASVATRMVLHGGAHMPPRLSIVVMPFRNLSDDHGRDYLADAISDDLTTDLSHIPGSLVIARASADAYKGRAVPAQEVGRALNVRYVLEGSIRPTGGTLRINAQLIDARDGGHIWSERFDTSAARLGQAQSDIVDHLATALDLALVEAEVARAQRERPNNPDALDLFNRARALRHTGTTLAEMTAAQGYLERAIKLEPDFVDALATLGLLLISKEQGFGYATQAADDREADTVIRHALELSPNNANALAARGRFLASSGRCAEATAAFDAALVADPTNADALVGISLCVWRLGQPEKVVAALEATQRVDPRGPDASRNIRRLGMAYLWNGQAQNAIKQLLLSDAAAVAAPEDVDNPSQQESTRVFLIAAYAMAGDMAEAKRRYAAYSAIWPRRSVFRQAAFFTPAQTGVPGFARIKDALAAVGMPRFSDEHGDCAAADSPPADAEFAATPCIIAGATLVDTETVHRMVNGPARPVVVDVGAGMAVIPGTVLLTEAEAASDPKTLAAAPLLRAASGIVVMGTGPAGALSYTTARRFAAAGFGTIYWYRGGEEAWSAAGLPSEDHRGN